MAEWMSKWIDEIRLYSDDFVLFAIDAYLPN